MLLLYTPATSFFLGELFSSVSINKILQSLPFFPPKLSNRRKWEELGIWSPTVFMDQHRSCLHWWTLAGSQQLGHRATQEARAHFSLTPALRLRGSLRIFLNQSIWHLLSLFNSTTALSFWFFFFFFPSAEIMVHTSQAGGRLFTTITAAWPAVLFHSYLTTYIQPPSQENLSHWQLMQISIFSINKLKVHFLKSWKVLQFKETN